MMHNADAAHALERDLRRTFGARLHALVIYGASAHAGVINALAVVDELRAVDLAECGRQVARWRTAGIATPLLLERGEFEASLDAFPFEFGAILADYEVVCGTDPFAGLAPDPADVRRACEVQARSHLLHLREGYIETAGNMVHAADLVAQSAAALAALLRNVGRMPHAPEPDPVLLRVSELAGGGTISGDESERLMPSYLDAMRALVAALDRWSEA